MGKKVVLRDYQQDLFNQLIKMPKTNVMVQLEAGAGKTYIELYLAEYLVKYGYKVAICTPWTLIRDQIQEKSWLDPKQVEITSAQILTGCRPNCLLRAGDGRETAESTA